MALMALMPLPPTDAELAQLACVDIYSPTVLTDAKFYHVDGGADHGIFYGIARINGFEVVTLRGSMTRLDWTRDFRAVMQRTDVGHVHSGFWAGMEQAWAQIKPLVSGFPVIVTGHSLGAARAAILVALMIRDGVPPTARVVFGEPKPGLVDLAKYIEGVPGYSYRNGDSRDHDLVTDVPFSFPPLQYVHPTKIIEVCHRPTLAQFAQDALFAWHHGAGYAAAVASYVAAQVQIEGALSLPN